MGRKEGKGDEREPSDQLIYLYDEAQFWTAYREKRGYIITKDETYVQKQYEDMILFMTDLLPFNYTEIARFGYRQFFRTLKIAQGEAKRRESQMNQMKNKRKK